MLIFEVDIRDGLGETALHKAACNSNLVMIKILVKAGCSLDIKNNDPEPKTPLGKNFSLFIVSL